MSTGSSTPPEHAEPASAASLTSPYLTVAPPTLSTIFTGTVRPALALLITLPPLIGAWNAPCRASIGAATSHLLAWVVKTVTRRSLSPAVAGGMTMHVGFGAGGLPQGGTAAPLRRMVSSAGSTLPAATRKVIVSGF